MDWVRDIFIPPKFCLARQKYHNNSKKKLSDEIEVTLKDDTSKKSEYPQNSQKHNKIPIRCRDFQKNYQNYGLESLGNRCYINSVLQILLNTEEFTCLLGGAKSKISKALKSLYLSTSESERNKYLLKFYKRYKKIDSNSVNGDQGDCKEFFLSLLRNIKNSGDSELSKVFYGSKVSKYESDCSEILNSNKIFVFINAGKFEIMNFIEHELKKHIDKKGGSMEFYCEKHHKYHEFTETNEVIMPEILCIYFDNSKPQTININEIMNVRTYDHELKFVGLIKREKLSGKYAHASTYYFKYENLYIFDDNRVEKVESSYIYSPYMIFFKVIKFKMN